MYQANDMPNSEQQLFFANETQVNKQSNEHFHDNKLKNVWVAKSLHFQLVTRIDWNVYIASGSS